MSARVAELLAAAANKDAIAFKGVAADAYYKHMPLLTLGISNKIHVFGANAPSTEGTHPMTAEHRITAVWVKDQKGEVEYLHEFDAKATAASIEFALNQPGGNRLLDEAFEEATDLTPYSLCNTHGVWEGPTVAEESSEDSSSHE